MAFPSGWPPRVGSGRRSIRFYQTGTTDGFFANNAFLFVDGVGANPYTPLPEILPGEDVSNPRYAGPHVMPLVPAGTGQRDDDPKPMIWSEYILVDNQGASDIEFSFDGVNVAGIVPAGTIREMERSEAGIAVRGGVAATGSITTVAVINLIDGETFTLDDGVNPPVVFEFDVAGDGVTPGNVIVDVSALTTADEVRDAIISAVTGVGAALLMTATDGGAATVDLTQDNSGTQGNTTQTETVVDAGFVLSNMTGGTGVDYRIEAW